MHSLLKFPGVNLSLNKIEQLWIEQTRQPQIMTAREFSLQLLQALGRFGEDRSLSRQPNHKQIGLPVLAVTTSLPSVLAPTATPSNGEKCRQTSLSSFRTTPRYSTQAWACSWPSSLRAPKRISLSIPSRRSRDHNTNVCCRQFAR